jgi:transcriptional regulator GlxA family with amidase domain
MNNRVAPRRFAMLAFPEVQMLDVTGPLEVFSVATHLHCDLSVKTLAQRACMSPRNFARVFTREVGITPGKFVERARVQEARRQLEETPHGVEQIAARCGFGTAETLRRVFWRTVHASPAEYRRRFQTSESESGVTGPAAS